MPRLIRRPLDEDLVERNGPARHRAERAASGSKWSVGIRQISSTYLRTVRWLPPAARRPRRRRTSAYDRDAATAARTCILGVPGTVCHEANTSSPDGRKSGHWGGRTRTPDWASKVPVFASYTTPHRSRSVSAPALYPARRYPSSSASGSSSDVSKLSASPYDDVGPIVLRDALGVHRRRRAAEVLGPIDQLGLGELEALGLAAACLLDHAAGRVVALAGRDDVLAAARVAPRFGADARGLARSRRLFATFEFALAFHAWFLPHRDAR